MFASSNSKRGSIRMSSFGNTAPMSMRPGSTGPRISSSGSLTGRERGLVDRPRRRRWRDMNPCCCRPYDASPIVWSARPSRAKWRLPRPRPRPGFGGIPQNAKVRNKAGAPAQPQREAVPVRERVLLRSLVENPEAREALLPGLPRFAVVRAFSIWPLIEAMHALYEEDPAFGYEALESRIPEEVKHLLSSALFADHSPEVFSREQAEAFLARLDNEELGAKYREIEKQIQVAERSGNMDEAMRLMPLAGDLKKRIRSVAG